MTANEKIKYFVTVILFSKILVYLKLVKRILYLKETKHVNLKLVKLLN